MPCTRSYSRQSTFGDTCLTTAARLYLLSFCSRVKEEVILLTDFPRDSQLAAVSLPLSGILRNVASFTLYETFAFIPIRFDKGFYDLSKLSSSTSFFTALHFAQLNAHNRTLPHFLFASPILTFNTISMHF
jgi:hypothetical protein